MSFYDRIFSEDESKRPWRRRIFSYYPMDLMPHQKQYKSARDPKYADQVFQDYRKDWLREKGRDDKEAANRRRQAEVEKARAERKARRRAELGQSEKTESVMSLFDRIFEADEHLRRLERAVAAGEPGARLRLHRARQKAGLPTKFQIGVGHDPMPTLIGGYGKKPTVQNPSHPGHPDHPDHDLFWADHERYKNEPEFREAQDRKRWGRE